MITEYAVPSLALNYHCKIYQIIYESVYSYMCTCMRNKYSCKSEFVWNIHIQVMLKVISISVLNMHELLNSQTNSQMYTFPDQINWQFVHILMASKFQSKLRVLDTLCKTKDFFVFCSGKLCLLCFHGFLFFCFICRLCQVHKINAQTPITANLSTYLIHEFIVNVKWRMDRSHRKPYICLSFDFLIQYSPMEHV